MMKMIIIIFISLGVLGTHFAGLYALTKILKDCIELHCT